MTAPNDRSTDGHADEGVLLAIHDGEQDAALDAYRAHVETCGHCQTRLSELARYAKHVREALSALPVRPAASAPPPRGSPRYVRVTTWWRRPAVYAIAATIVVAAIAIAGPIRRWVAERIAPADVSHPHGASSTPTALAPSDLTGSTITFSPSGPEFVVRFNVRPSVGALKLERTAAAVITARITSGAGTGGDAMIVLPQELRIENLATSRASYTLSVPPSVVRVRVIVAGSAVFDGSGPAEVRLIR
jgi:hypothetical protein